jgi:hypothetical protein
MSYEESEEEFEHAYREHEDDALKKFEIAVKQVAKSHRI